MCIVLGLFESGHVPIDCCRQSGIPSRGEHLLLLVRQGMVVLILPICELDKPRPRCRSDGFAHERLDVTLTNSFGERHRLLSGEYDFYRARFFWSVDFICCLLLPFAHPHVGPLLFLRLFHLSGNLLFQHVFEVQVVAIVDFHIGQ